MGSLSPKSHHLSKFKNIQNSHQFEKFEVLKSSSTLDDNMPLSARVEGNEIMSNFKPQESTEVIFQPGLSERSNRVKTADQGYQRKRVRKNQQQTSPVLN